MAQASHKMSPTLFKQLTDQPTDRHNSFSLPLSLSSTSSTAAASVGFSPLLRCSAPFNHQSIHLLIYQFIYPWIKPFMHPFFYSSINLSIYLLIYPSIYSFIHLSIYSSFSMLVLVGKIRNHWPMACTSAEVPTLPTLRLLLCETDSNLLHWPSVLT